MYFLGKIFFVLIWFLPFCLFAEADFSLENNSETEVTIQREKMITSFLNSRFSDFSYSALRIVLDKNLKEPRGRMQGKTITLSSQIVGDSEFFKLFLHEFAHFLDIFVLVPSNGRDASSLFYDISWFRPTIKKAWEKQFSFVSGYAATNQYEDFAESFVMYVFHNQTFQDKALRNESLRKKYLFFAEYVFGNGAFVWTDFSIGKVPNYLWDTTKLPISLQKYLYSLH